MIQHSEIKNLETEWGLREDVIEKDYVIGWLLWGIGSHVDLRDTWVFKGGTCLKKCYFETYRFSEDLDFTVLPGGAFKPDDVPSILDDVGTLRGSGHDALAGAKPALRCWMELCE